MRFRPFFILNVNTKFLNKEILDELFVFSGDERAEKDRLNTNTLARPQLITYYLKAVENWR